MIRGLIVRPAAYYIRRAANLTKVSEFVCLALYQEAQLVNYLLTEQKSNIHYYSLSNMQEY